MPSPLIVAAFALMQAASPPPAVKIPEGEALTAAIAAADAEFFKLQFLGCDPVKLASRLTADLEFYHDKDGVVVTSREPFVAGYAKSCEEKKAPDAWRSRRELVSGTMRVNPVPGYGAVEEGAHVFYERKGDGPEKLVGKARFTVLWKLDDGQWKIARIFSIDHAAIN